MRRTRLGLLLSAAAVLSVSACAGIAAPETQTNRAAYADFLIARVANLRDDHRAAADRYFDALAKSPARAELLEGALHSALASGDAQRARQAARMADARGEDIASARLVQAADALNARRWGAAERLLSDLNGDGVEEIAARMMRLWAQAGAGDGAAAAGDLALLSAPRPFAGMFDYQRALLFDYAGRNDEAVATYAAARTSGVWAPPASVREADLLARLGRGQNVRALYQGGNGRIRDPDLARAVDSIEAGEAGAAQTLTPARGAAIGLYTLAALLANDDEEARALPLFTLALMLDPRLDAARLLYADSQRSLGAADEAQRALSDISLTSPYAETARATSAWILRQEDHEDEAIAAARAGVEAGGGRLARVTLADLYRSTSRWAEADAEYTAIINSLDSPNAGDWQLFFSRASAREQLDRWPEAEADLRRALELSPEQPEALNFLGYALVDRNLDLEGGLALIQRAVAARPQAGHIIDSLGWAYYRMGDYEQALEHLDLAVELEPADATLNDHLGDALWRLGRRTEARYQWSRALSLQPSDRERAAIERKLAEGLPADASDAAASAAR